MDNPNYELSNDFRALNGVVSRQFGSEKRDCLEAVYIAPKSYTDEECVYAFLNRYKKEFPKLKGQTKEELVWRRSATFRLYEQPRGYDLCKNFDTAKMLRDTSHHHLVMLPQHKAGASL